MFNKIKLVALLVFLAITQVFGEDSLKRVYSDVDESSCICGLNEQILNRLERIFNSSPDNCQAISISTSAQSGSKPENNIKPEEQTNVASTNDAATSGNAGLASGGSATGNNVIGAAEQGQESQRTNESLVDKLAEEIKNLQSQLANLASANGQQTFSGSHSSNIMLPNGSMISGSAPIQTQQSNFQTTYPTQSSLSFQLDSSLNPQRKPESVSSASGNAAAGSGQGSSQGDSELQDERDNNRPQLIGSNYFQGIGGISVTPASNEALMKLNNSQKVDSSTIQNAIQTTIPSVVSNIFSNIQNLAIQTEQNQSNDATTIESPQQGGKLTSIDGSSISVSGSSVDQISAQGEQLFAYWIEHQLQALHLTASMAANIERNALNLFRRIVRQYVERVSKMGGRVEDNVKRATQIALNNTQNLCAFLLKNYINFAGGLMQIIGEQVSRVGKQLDATGDSIANINLNPFDIVSNVIESLPNPARYSEYFRAVGKYLMGELSHNQQTATSQQQQQQQQQQQPQQQVGGIQDQPGGIFSKTMGALSKTFGHWIMG